MFYVTGEHVTGVCVCVGGGVTIMHESFYVKNKSTVCILYMYVFMPHTLLNCLKVLLKLDI